MLHQPVDIAHQRPDVQPCADQQFYKHLLTPYPALILCNDFNVRSLLAYNISLLIYNVNSYLIDYQCFS